MSPPDVAAEEDDVEDEFDIEEVKVDVDDRFEEVATVEIEPLPPCGMEDEVDATL